MVRRALGLIAIIAGACGPRPVPWKEGAAASAAALDAAVARPWIRMTPRGTSMCVRLPDGTFHQVVYGVGGGADGFEFHPSVQVPATRDVDCSDYGVTTLGERGVVASFVDGVVYPADVQPVAEAMHVGPGWTCFVSSAGTAWCSGSTRPAFDLGALGPVAEIVGDDCVRYRDGQVVCRAPGQTPPYQVYWTDARQASSEGGVSCAVLASGQVSCRGDNRFAQRGFTGEVAAGEATLVPGLDGVDEVRTSGAHVCARRGGEVWCWGQAGEGQAGAIARRKSTGWPRCAVDEARTEQARREHDQAVATCQGPRPPGDDPFCRAVSGSYVETVFVGNPGRDCDPAGAIRFAPPTRVDEVSDAIALATRGSMTCALRADRRLVCWGAGASGAKELAIVAAAAPAEARYQRPAPAPSLMVNEWGVLVHGATALTFHSWRGGEPLGKGRAIDGAIDATLAPGLCTLAAGGAVACEAAFDSPASTATAPPGFDRFAGRARSCFTGAGGEVGCVEGGEPTAARLTAAGPVVDVQSGCARYADGRVRCFATRGGVRTEQLDDVLDEVVSLAEPLWPLTMCAVKRDGGVWCVGGAFDPMRAPPPAPVAIAGAPPSTAVAASYQHACVLATDGTVWCWGRTVEGQVGSAAPSRGEVTTTPVQVAGVTGVIAIAAGSGRSCALTGGGDLRCWGNGSPRVQTVATDLR